MKHSLRPDTRKNMENKTNGIEKLDGIYELTQSDRLQRIKINEIIGKMDTFEANLLSMSRIIEKILDAQHAAEFQSDNVDKQGKDKAYVTGQQSSRSVAPQDVEIAQEKLGDVSGSLSQPAVYIERAAPLTIEGIQAVVGYTDEQYSKFVDTIIKKEPALCKCGGKHYCGSANCRMFCPCEGYK